MFKRVSILILIGVLCLSSFTFLHIALTASEAPSVEWSKRYSGATASDGWPYIVIETSDGGYAIAGRTEAFGAGSFDYWLIKTDTHGTVQWNRTYGGVGREIWLSLIQTEDGGYMLVGDTESFGAGGFDAWLVKTDANGNMQWNKTYGGASYDFPMTILQTSDRGYLFAGSTMSFGAGGWDMWLVKIDESGDEQWNRTYGGSSADTAVQIVQTGEGGYAVFGGTGSDWWLVKIDVEGNQLWNKTYDGRGWDDTRAIVQTSDGGYALFGHTANGDVDFWLVKTDENGNSLWNKTYGGVGAEFGGFGLLQTSDGGYAFVGETNSFGAGGFDFWLVKTDSTGNMQWNQTYGGAGDDVGQSIVQTTDGGFAMCGYTNSFSGDGSYEVWLIKLRGSGPKTWIVDDDGPADFSTIQEAINAAWDGDTIFVRNGTYSGIVIDKSLTIEGEDKYTTIIQGGSEPYGAGMRVLANNVRISKFTIQNARGPPIRVHGDEGPSYGNITISDNIMIGNGEGLRLINTTGNLITGNVIRDASRGIGFDWASGNIVRSNTLMNVDWGIHGGYPSYNNTFLENTIIGNGTAVEMNNLFENNKFFHNNFINNTIQVDLTEGSNIWDNGYPSGGNYWSDYNGSDLYLGPAQDQVDSDGIGDTSYYIDENNTDHYPLMSPWTVPDAAALNISSSRNIVGQGSSTNVTVFLENQGSKIEELNATFFANDTYIGHQSFMLRSNNSVIYSSEWDLGSLAKGNYSLSICIASLEGETDLNDNSLNDTFVFITIPGDLNGDKTVDIFDAIILANYYGFDRYYPSWNPDVDLNEDGIIDIFDAIVLAANYGKSWT